MPEPSVNVVIATRGDRPALLADAIESVLTQDYDGFVDLTVVYDSLELPTEPVPNQESPHRRVAWVWNDGDHGLAQARNRGAVEGQHPLLAFLDDDDVWLPGKLTRQVRLMQRHPELPLTGTGIEIVTADERRTARPAPSDRITHGDLLRSRVAELHPSSFVIRRDAFQAVGGVDEALPGAYAEDYDLVLRLSRDADLGMVVEPLVLVRWTGGSYFFSRWQTIVDALEALLAKHEDLASDPRGSARVLGQIAFAQAAMGQRRDALRMMARAARAHPLEPRVLLAGLATAGVPADRIQAVLHRTGRGV